MTAAFFPLLLLTLNPVVSTSSFNRIAQRDLNPYFRNLLTTRDVLPSKYFTLTGRVQTYVICPDKCGVVMLAQCEKLNAK